MLLLVRFAHTYVYIHAYRKYVYVLLMSFEIHYIEFDTSLNLLEFQLYLFVLYLCKWRRSSYSQQQYNSTYYNPR